MIFDKLFEKIREIVMQELARRAAGPRVKGVATVACAVVNCHLGVGDCVEYVDRSHDLAEVKMLEHNTSTVGVIIKVCNEKPGNRYPVHVLFGDKLEHMAWHELKKL
jgi:hypothetical protein